MLAHALDFLPGSDAGDPSLLMLAAPSGSTGVSGLVTMDVAMRRAAERLGIRLVDP